MCRKQHGAAFATYADIKPGSLSWLAGEALVKTYEGPSGGGWCFCSICGSTIAGTEKGTVTSITPATLDDEASVSPACHIYTGSKANWYNIDDDLPQYPERCPED